MFDWFGEYIREESALARAVPEVTVGKAGTIVGGGWA